MHVSRGTWPVARGTWHMARGTCAYPHIHHYARSFGARACYMILDVVQSFTCGTSQRCYDEPAANIAAARTTTLLHVVQRGVGFCAGCNQQVWLSWWRSRNRWQGVAKGGNTFGADVVRSASGNGDAAVGHDLSFAVQRF